MKKRVLCICLAFVLCLLIAMPTFAATDSNVETRQAIGTCSMNASGTSVFISASSSSGITEDVIRASAYLWEYHSGTWICVGSATNTRYGSYYVSASTTVGVAGNHYYRVTGVHYSQTGDLSNTTTSYTSQQWISA